jgi:hypothetical protein
MNTNAASKSGIEGRIRITRLRWVTAGERPAKGMLGIAVPPRADGWR